MVGLISFHIMFLGRNLIFTKKGIYIKTGRIRLYKAIGYLEN